jgi:hypothetical protein
LLSEREISKQDKTLIRHPNENLRSFLLNTLAVLLDGSGQHIVHQFCDLYEHARYDPNEFLEEEFQSFTRLMKKLIDVYVTKKKMFYLFLLAFNDD